MLFAYGEIPVAYNAKLTRSGEGEGKP